MSHDGVEIPRHPEHEHLPLGEYLAWLWPDRPQRGIAALFAGGRVRSRGRPVSPRCPAAEAPELELRGALDSCPSIHLGDGEAPGLAILHQDTRLAAVDKPSGVPVVPDRSRGAPSVLGWLIRRELAERAWKPVAEWVRHRIVHRIDRLTSGLVLVARTAEHERLLSAAFEERRVGKEYLAILAGEVRPARVTVHCPVVPGRKGRMRAELGDPKASPPPLDALTELEVLERFRAHTLVRARPRTGRTHQIRVHAWAAGHPLAVDPLYGPPADAAAPPPGIQRLTLHSHHCELPVELGEPRSFTSPLPGDFAGALELLRGGRP